MSVKGKLGQVVQTGVNGILHPWCEVSNIEGSHSRIKEMANIYFLFLFCLFNRTTEEVK